MIYHPVKCCKCGHKDGISADYYLPKGGDFFCDKCGCEREYEPDPVKKKPAHRDEREIEGDLDWAKKRVAESLRELSQRRKKVAAFKRELSAARKAAK